MTNDRILFDPKEGTTGFWLLRNVPELPKSITDYYTTPAAQAKYIKDHYDRDYEEYQKALALCKSNRLEIVNPEDHTEIENMNGWYHFKSGDLKPGDIFDLPNGYRFEETCKGCGANEVGMALSLRECCSSNAEDARLLRLVPLTVKEEVNGVDKFCINYHEQGDKIIRIYNPEGHIFVMYPYHLYHEAEEHLKRLNAKPEPVKEENGAHDYEQELKEIAKLGEAVKEEAGESQPMSAYEKQIVQKELWTEIERECIDWSTPEIRMHELLKRFTIQRKKK